jgi:hypothetical protein
MYGSICAVFLIFIASTGYRLSSNLSVLQQIDLPAGEHSDGLEEVAGQTYINILQQNSRDHERYFRSVRKLFVSTDGVRLSNDAWIPFWISALERVECAAPNQNISYAIENNNDQQKVLLQVVDNSLYVASKIIATIPITWNAAHGKYHAVTPSPQLRLWQDRLYVIGHNLAILDVSNPRSPRLLSVSPLRFPERYDEEIWDEGVLWDRTSNGVIWHYPSIYGLPDIECLKAAIRVSRFQFWVFDGEILCEIEPGYISEYRLNKLTNTRAFFTQVGRINSNLVDDFFGYQYASAARLVNGILYVTQGYGGEMNERISFYDTHGPNAPRLIGHFAAPGGWMDFHPLPDGRIIIASNKIYLVGLPSQK